jgi:ATP-dependent exoDNAse (exonuclease V) beta subunit
VPLLSLSENLQQDYVMAFYTSLAYEASAGSGKTFALVIRYISLLYLGAKPNTILTLTFTNKAANEMKARISAVLAELHLPSRDAERAAIAQTLEVSESEIIQKREILYQNYLNADLRISTIDKFFAQVLRLFSQHLGLMPDFTIDELNDEQRFLLRFLINVKQADAYKDLVLFSAQESKKLGDIFSLLGNLYEKDAELRNLVFEKDAPFPTEKEIMILVDSLRELFRDNCPNLSDRGWNALNKVENIETLQQATWLAKESLNYWDFKKCYIPQMDDILHEIKIKLALYFNHKEKFLLAKYMKLYDLYKQTLLEENISTNQLAFNDVTNLLFKLLHEKIDKEFLYFRLDASIDHLLIDEFQDTNIVQYKILEPIIEEIHAGVGSSELKSFFYVGDIKQSIYRFRGGAKELFHYVQKRYDVTLAQLNTNYRSDCNIVRFVNDSFANIITKYTPQECKKNDNAGYIKVENYEDVAEGIVTELFLLLEQGIHADDIAILTHTNPDAFTIEELLLEKDKSLKITTQTTKKLINSRYVSAVIELLKYLYFHEEICKANFLTLIGRPWESELNFSLKKHHHDLPLLIKEIIRHFQLPGQDRNLLKLIETVSEYKDIEAFLFESETLNIDSPTKKSEGIKILTIHKSKGLEFKHIILADRLTKEPTDRSTFIYAYDDITLEQIYIRTRNRENVDKAYLEAVEKEKKLRREDKLNALYVAFTRAEHSLVIVQKEDKNSAFSLLNLAPCEIGTLKKEKKKESIQTPTEVTYSPLRLGLQEQKINKEEAYKDDIYAINFGNALHYLLEILDGFDHEDLQNAYWAMKNRYEIVLKDGDAQKILQRVKRLLSYEPFCALIEGEITKEQPVIYNNELKQLDLLVAKEDKFIIIDYKSSAQIRSEHKKQVRHYHKAITEITNSPVEAYLCYIREDEIELVQVV